MYDKFYYYNNFEQAKNLAVEKGRTEYVWLLHESVDYSDFDLRWSPNRFQQHQCHAWPSHNNTDNYSTWLLPINDLKHKKDIEVNYHSHTLTSKNKIEKIYWENPNASFREKINWLKSILNDEQWYWICDKRIDYKDFNFDWLPDFWDWNLNQAFTMYGTDQLSYTWLVNRDTLNNEEFKYIPANLKFSLTKKICWNDPNASIKEKLSWLASQVSDDNWYWVCDNRIDYSNFDFNWLPDHWDSELNQAIVMLGSEQLSYTWLINKQTLNQNNFNYVTSDLKFTSLPKLTWPTNVEKLIRDYKAVDWIQQNISDDNWYWLIDDRLDYSDFDFNWLPDQWDVNKIHCFGIKSQPDIGLTWLVNQKLLTSPQFKAMTSDVVFKDAITRIEWPENIDQLLIDNNDVVKWIKQQNLPTGWYWFYDSRVDYTAFNFNWLPSSWELNFNYCFTLKNQPNVSYTWLINTALLDSSSFKYIDSDLEFRNALPKIKWPDNVDAVEQGISWQDNMVDWLQTQALPDGWFWVVNQHIDYKHFDFNWLPDQWDFKYTHCFTMKGQDQLSYTWLTNKQALQKPEFNYVPSNLEFAEPIARINWPNFLSHTLSGHDWYDSMVNWVLEQKLVDGWYWICDNRIDYSDFNFAWLPTNWDLEYIHCFTLKNNNTLSYTWLINTASIKNKKFKYYRSNLEISNSYDLITLDVLNEPVTGKSQRYLGDMVAALNTAIKKSSAEWLWVTANCCDYAYFNFNYKPELDQIDHTHCWPSGLQEKGETFLIHIPSFNRINEFRFNFGHEAVVRKTWPIVEYQQDNLVEAIKTHTGKSIYTVYQKQGTKIFSHHYPCIWEKRPVVSYNNCNSTSLVPRDCIVKEEIYEYAYLEKSKTALASDVDITVVFLHNNEKNYQYNETQLHYTMPKSITNLKVISNTTPRLKAYKSAAEESNDDWFLAVFAKCYMKESFSNFKWRPDYWQKPKHYIFHNHNTDLDITYGHMAPIAYNKKLMLINNGGIDMTLAQAHTVVPLVISETRLTDPWDTWRTAFRETVKLMYYAQKDNSLELHYRLSKWLRGTDKNTWYIRGANDAKDFFNSVDGELHWVLMTNEWDWLRKKFDTLYSADLKN